MDNSKFFSFLGGLAAGAIIALLLAPDKGSETRRKISEKLEAKGIKFSSEELDEFIEMLKSKFDKKATEVTETASPAED